MTRVKLSLPESVWRTVCWFDVFGQPVSATEIHRYLFGHKATLAEVERALWNEKRISRSLGFYFLRRQGVSVIRRCQRQYHAGKLWRKVLRKRFLFRWTPFLRLVTVGNTLAMGWPEKNSDIDLLVVASGKRLFTARAFLTFFAELARIRRRGRKIAGRFCLSFFVGDGQLNLAPLKIGRADPYLAFWVATLVPVWGNAAPEFFAANAWIREYFPNLKLPTTQKKFRKKGWLEVLLAGKIGDFLEARLKKWQLARSRRKRRNPAKNAVVISDAVLKFHETDQRREFLREWEARFNSKSRASR